MKFGVAVFYKKLSNMHDCSSDRDSDDHTLLKGLCCPTLKLKFCELIPQFTYVNVRP